MARKREKPAWTHALFKLVENGPCKKLLGWVLGKRTKLLNTNLLRVDSNIKLKALHSYVEPMMWSRCKEKLKIHALLIGAVLEDGGEYIVGTEEMTFREWLKISDIMRDLKQ